MVRIVRDGMDEMGCDGWEFHLRGTCWKCID